MTTEPATWHHGLMAEWWSHFHDDFRAHELEYYLDAVSRLGGPVLDAGCGSGRVRVSTLVAAIARSSSSACSASAAPGTGTSRALRRLHEHLEPGGTLLLDLEVPWSDPDAWACWTPAGRQALPAPWPSEPHHRVAPTGATYTMANRILACDPISQSLTYETRIERWRDDEFVVFIAHREQRTSPPPT